MELAVVGRQERSRRQRQGRSVGPAGAESKKVVMLNLGEEDVRDQDAVRLVFQKNQKMIKYLFGRYSAGHASTAGAANFQAPGHSQGRAVALAEAIKMLRELGVSQQAVSKNDAAQIVKLVNKQHGRADPQPKLDYDGFVEFILQTAYFLYRDQHQEDPKRCLVELLKSFTKNSLSARAPMPLPPYQEGGADLASMSEAQRDKVAQLEAFAQRQPNYVPPEGYSTYKELQQVTSYKVPPSFPIKESQRISLEILDELLFSAIGKHFLEPIVAVQQVTKFRPKFQHGRISYQLPDNSPIVRSAEPSSRRARSERRLSPLRGQSAKAEAMLQRQSAKVDPAESETKASSNRPPLPAKAAGRPPKNRALQQKLQDMEREADEQQQREARFKRR